MTLIRVQIRGFSIELEPDDPRAKQVEALLLGPVEPPEPQPPPELPLPAARPVPVEGVGRLQPMSGVAETF